MKMAIVMTVRNTSECLIDERLNVSLWNLSHFENIFFQIKLQILKHECYLCFSYVHVNQ